MPGPPAQYQDQIGDDDDGIELRQDRLLKALVSGA